MLIKFHNNQFPSPCITISSSTVEILEWIKSKVKAGTIKGKKNYLYERSKDSYAYELRYDKAIELLNDIIPCLVIEAKRKKLKLQ